MNASPSASLDAFHGFPARVAELSRAVDQLQKLVETFPVPPVAQREWYELLQRKLLPQLGRGGFLIVAVVGGTNIGKSVIFNHLAGGAVSAVSPMASGTKHPTAILAQSLLDRIDLRELFPDFQVEPAIDPEAALREEESHRLFYRVYDGTPPNLIVLDTPDVDSVARVNWERADAIRQSADVLIAVLTQQKYNDAAVKEFFRQAAVEGKQVIVAFNQVQLPEDEAYWPLWLETFAKETGVPPALVYLAPFDRSAAQENRLPFWERTWPPVENDTGHTPRNLMRDLADLKFADIKLRSLLGALDQVVDRAAGVPAWLAEIRIRSGEFREAIELMSSKSLVEINRWPTLPNAVLIRHIRDWWADQREGWTSRVHGFYNRLGRFVAAPVKLIRERTSGPPVDPLETYRQAEWNSVLEILERTLERLSWLRDLNHPLLGPRLEALLSGSSRAELIERVRAAHQLLDFSVLVRSLVDQQLHRFREESAESYRLFRRLDSVAAAARPAVSVALFLTGAGPLGDALAPVAANAAMQGLLHVAGDAVGGTVVTAVGDKVITDTASTSAGYLEAKFRQMHTAFARERMEWMAEQLEEYLFGGLPRELATSAAVASSPEYLLVQRLTDDLRVQLVEQQPRAGG